MTLLDLLAHKRMTITDLSRASGVANSTLNDIAHGKYNLIDCSGRILLSIAKALKISIEKLLSLEEEEAESLLPLYLIESIKKFRRALRKNDMSFAGEYLMEINSSINVAEVDNWISKETANRLRKRYL